MAKRGAKQKEINLALQGGGAHGAFTWGVVDRLLEDPRVRIAAISGTSAGAMNAVAVAAGLSRDGEDGARAALEHLWQAVSEVGRLSPIQRAPIDMFMGNWSLDHNPAYLFFDMVHRVASPYDMNPMNLNPLQAILDTVIDFDAVRACEAIKLFISATNVETGRVAVFDRHTLTSDMVLASACVPHLFRAVEIDGVPYWDGGFMGNPVLFPFFYSDTCRDIVIVQINPVERRGTPQSAREILNRVNEITFNSSLLRELRAIDFVTRLIDDGKLDPKEYCRANVHIIGAHEEMADMGASSKLNAEWAFLRHLFDIGRDKARDWLDECYDGLGDHSTIDTRALYQG